MERATRLARCGGIAGGTRLHRGDLGRFAAPVRRLARGAAVDQRGRAPHRPARHLRTRARLQRRRRERRRGVVCHPDVLRAGRGRRRPVRRRRRALPHQRRPDCRHRPRPRGRQLTDVDRRRRAPTRSRPAFAPARAVRTGSRGRADSPVGYAGVDVPADRRRPRGHGPQRNGPRQAGRRDPPHARLGAGAASSGPTRRTESRCWPRPRPASRLLSMRLRPPALEHAR